jgi:hypothetical protein
VTCSVLLYYVKDPVIEYNEWARQQENPNDGQALDLDAHCLGTALIQYNYFHENEDASILAMEDMNDLDKLIIRYNVFQNEKKEEKHGSTIMKISRWVSADSQPGSGIGSLEFYNNTVFSTGNIQLANETVDIVKNNIFSCKNRKLTLPSGGTKVNNILFASNYTGNAMYMDPCLVNGGDAMPTTQPETLMDHFGSTSRRSQANKFASEKYDRLMKESATTFDQGKRKALVKEAEMEWIAQSPWTVILHRVSAWAHKSDLEGFNFYGSGTHAWISSLGRSIANMQRK